MKLSKWIKNTRNNTQNCLLVRFLQSFSFRQFSRNRLSANLNCSIRKPQHLNFLFPLRRQTSPVTTSLKQVYRRPLSCCLPIFASSILHSSYLSQSWTQISASLCEYANRQINDVKALQKSLEKTPLLLCNCLFQQSLQVCTLILAFKGNGLQTHPKTFLKYLNILTFLVG